MNGFRFDLGMPSPSRREHAGCAGSAAPVSEEIEADPRAQRLKAGE